MRTRLGRLLRRWADRIDQSGEPRRSIWSFTYEGGANVKWRKDGRGCPVWYYQGDDHGRAYTEADRDWRSPTEKLNDIFTKFGAALAEGAGKPARAYGGPVLPPQPMPYDPATDGPIRRLEDQ